MSQNIAIYARVSSDKQTQERTIEYQTDALEEFARENGYQIDRDLIFIDNGVSGTTLARKGLDSLRDKASRGEIDKLLILNPDRLARKYAHQLLLIDEFHKLGVEIQFLNCNISRSPEDQLLLQIQGVIAEYEREKIIDRSRRGKLHKAKQGKVSVLSAAPYGYVYIPANNNEEARYEIHRSEAEVVRQIYKMLVEKQMSVGAIAHDLTKTGLRSRKDVGYWDRSVVWNILTNPAYMGKAAYGKTEVVDRKRPTKQAYDRNFYPKHLHPSGRSRPREEWITIAVPAIVSEELFSRAQEQLQENKRFSQRNNKKREYLLSGLLRCQECGYALFGRPVSKSKTNRRYYKCMGQDGYRLPHGRVCSSHPVRVEVLDEMVWMQIKQLIEQPEIVLKQYMERVEKKQKQRAEFDQLVANKKKELKQHELEKERLLDLYQSGQVSLAEIEQRLKSIRAKTKQTQGEILLLEKEENEEIRRLQLLEQFNDFTQHLASNLSNLNYEQKKQIIRLLVDQIIVDMNKAEITIRHILPLGQKGAPLCCRSDLPVSAVLANGLTGLRAGVESRNTFPFQERLLN